jgi:pseudouridine-5'-phosphate glycosidase/pseudouridine kinase
MRDCLITTPPIDTQWQLGMNNGALIAVPIPEDYEKAGSKIQEAVDQAVAESEQNGINKRGKEVTPWLLKRVSELTNETSLASNIALLENTARVGTSILSMDINTVDTGCDQEARSPYNTSG